MKTIISTVFLTLILASSAFANNFPFNINTFESYLNGQNGGVAASYTQYTGSLTGSYDVTALAFEAGDQNLFVDGFGTTLFDTGATGNFGTWTLGVDLTLATYDSVTQGDSFGLNDTNAVHIYQLTQSWLVPELGINLAAGTLLFGLNDTGSGDGDYDDLIIAAVTTATPIPGAVWLLGSGLLGLVGLRKSQRS